MVVFPAELDVGAGYTEAALSPELFATLTGLPRPVPETRASKPLRLLCKYVSALRYYLMILSGLMAAGVLVTLVNVFRACPYKSRWVLARTRFWCEWLQGLTQSVYVHKESLDLLYPVAPTARRQLLERLRNGHRFPLPPFRCKPTTNVLLMNHQSLLDVILLTTAVPLKSRSVAKEELRNFPLFGNMWGACGGYFVRRGGGKETIDHMRKISAEFRDSHAPFAIFPEGTRNRAGDGIMAYKKGGFHMALDAKCPLLIYVTSPQRWLRDPKTGVAIEPWYYRRTGQPLRLVNVVLRPISTEDLGKADMDSMIRRTWQLMQLTFEALDRLVATETGLMPRMPVNQRVFRTPAGEYVAATAAHTPFDRKSCQPSVWPASTDAATVYDPRSPLTREGILGSFPEILRPYALGYPALCA